MIRFDIPYVDTDRTLTQAGYEVFRGQERRIDAAEGQIAVLEAADAVEAANAPGSAPRYACRAWVNFNGTGVIAIRAAGNVSSITDSGVGDYTVNFATAMPDASYGVSAIVGGIPNALASLSSAPSIAAGSFRLVTFNSNTGALTDAAQVHAAVFR